MTEAQKSLKQQLKNNGLYVDDSTGTPVLKDGQGRVIGGGGGGGEKEIINVALTKSGSSGNFTGNITAEQKEKLRYMKAVLRATLIATSPVTVVYFEVFAVKFPSGGGIQLWGVSSYFGAQVAILWVAEDNSIVLEPITFYSKMEVGNMLNEKQNKITAGTAAPSGGADGDVYIQYEG